MTNFILDPEGQPVSISNENLYTPQISDNHYGDTEIIFMGRKLGYSDGWDGISNNGQIYMVYGFRPLNPNIKIPASDLVEFDFHLGKILLYSKHNTNTQLVSTLDMIEILRFIPMIED